MLTFDRQAISSMAFQQVHHMLSQILHGQEPLTLNVLRPLSVNAKENLSIFRQEAQAYLDLLLPSNFVGVLSFTEEDCMLVLAMRKDDEVKAASVNMLRLAEDMAEVKNTGQEPNTDNVWVKLLHDKLATFQSAA